ncbi:MAG: hypothetical protein LAT64_13880 [Phycisphaerales bacterium]|nr:hypothetical protein [Planctomycetota bacterium]MCH8509839.1 hypothetical protein [Phycisphaerales bacterium]
MMASVLYISLLALLFIRPVYYLLLLIVLLSIKHMFVPGDSSRYRVTRRATAPVVHAMFFVTMCGLVAVLGFRLMQYLHNFIDWIRHGSPL